MFMRSGECRAPYLWYDLRRCGSGEMEVMMKKYMKFAICILLPAFLLSGCGGKAEESEEAQAEKLMTVWYELCGSFNVEHVDKIRVKQEAADQWIAANKAQIVKDIRHLVYTSTKAEPTPEQVQQILDAKISAMQKSGYKLKALGVSGYSMNMEVTMTIAPDASIKKKTEVATQKRFGEIPNRQSLGEKEQRRQLKDIYVEEMIKLYTDFEANKETSTASIDARKADDTGLWAPLKDVKKPGDLHIDY